MQWLKIFPRTDIFIRFNPSLGYFKSRKDILQGNTYMIRPLCRYLLNDSNEIWFSFFRDLYKFLRIFEVY
jgi:hypothetical protein